MDSRYILQLQSAQGVGIAAQRVVLDFVVQHGLTLEDFFALPINDWRQSGLSEQQTAALAASQTVSEAQRWADELARNKIQIIYLGDSQYPERLRRILGKSAPPILAAWGNLQLLERPAVGWCGSRNASAQGIDFTRTTVEQAVAYGITVVSGAARGIDTSAHHTALANNGATIVVAAEGILSFRLRTEIKQLATANNTLVLSEFQPNALWSATHAMIRNHTLIGLSNALIVVEAGLQGGTYEAGSFALKTGVPLFVAEYIQPSESATGNAHFLQRGATSIRYSQVEQRVDLQRLFDDILSHHDNLKQPPTSSMFQGMLFADATVAN